MRAAEPKSDFELDVDDDEITVAISKAVPLRVVMEGLIGSDLECEEGADGQFRTFLEKARPGWIESQSELPGQREHD